MSRRPTPRICNVPGCPEPATNRGRCHTHGGNHTGRSPGRDRGAQRRFRKAVLDRDQHRCTDCGGTLDLRACHTVPIAAGGGYRPDEGITRCAACDRATDPFAR